MYSYKVFGCVLFIACVWAAPVSEKSNKGEKKRSANQVQDQEKQLESLLSLAGKNIQIPNVAVHKSHTTHVENTNGQEVKHEEVEQRVTNTETGEVVSDVQQDVTESKSPNGNEPHRVVETKVDIPAEDIHKTIIQNTAKDGVEDGSDESIEFTPTAVAEYLLETGEFENFYSALQDLVNSSVMTESEAENYQQEVMAEYQRLLAEIDAYQAELSQQDSVPTYYPQAYPPQVPQKKSNDLYKYNDYQGAYNPEELSLENQQVVQEALINNQRSLSAAIDALLEAWWNQAFEAGDARAQALVEYLYSIVSKDDDMDDIGQIREILAEMLARALMEDMSETEQSQPVISEEEGEDTSSSSQTSSESEESAESEESPEEPSNEDEDMSSEENTESSSNESSEETENKVATEEKPEAPVVPVLDKTAKM
ncbi:hypothetical protein SNE40_007252 [Patella caerulea]|uniref:Uncharacterized protein n=1 Tax=Patella caerulea TaxID=87958 RepID=A0AAN8K388_PATCE